MKIVYFLIPLLIVYTVLVIIYLNDYMKTHYMDLLKEDFDSEYATPTSNDMITKDELSLNSQAIKYKNGLNDMHDQITDPISDVYLPYYEGDFEAGNSVQNKMNEYIIINVYKNLLDRQPNPDELNKHLQEFYEKRNDEETLKMRIYNSTEYKMIVKMQSNDVDAGLISTVSAEDLLDKLKRIYRDIKLRDPDQKMLLPLKDCYIHLQYNDYLFRAMIVHDNFGNFEKAVLEAPMLSREKMLELFNKHFLLSELRLVANEFKKQEILKKNASALPISLQTGAGASLNELGNMGNAGSIGNAGGSNCLYSSNMTYGNLGAGQQIADIVQDGKNVFNINIMLNDDMLQSKAYSNDINRKIYNEHGDTYDNVCHIKQQKKRIYNPIKYQQQYRGDMRYRPNVCSYGTKQVVQPVFVNSRTLFQGTDLKEATENTQVGSIMPKFEYREYEEIDE